MRSPASRRGRDTYFNEDLEIAQVRYKHALRRLQRAYPGVFCGWSEHAPERMVDWVLMWECMGHSIPAAVAAAHVCRCNLQKAAERVSGPACTMSIGECHSSLEPEKSSRRVPYYTCIAVCMQSKT